MLVINVMLYLHNHHVDGCSKCLPLLVENIGKERVKESSQNPDEGLEQPHGVQVVMEFGLGGDWATGEIASVDTSPLSRDEEDKTDRQQRQFSHH